MKSIHYLKSRNSDYLAGTDLEIFELEGRSKVLTVSKVEYLEKFRVNGKIKDKGIVFYFKEDYAKPMIVNPTNARIINAQTGIIDLKKCVGLSIEFYFNMSVEMKVSKTETIKGGIRIKKVITNGLIPPLEAIEDRIDKCTNRAEVMAIWRSLTEEQQPEFKDMIETKYKLLK